MYYPGANLRIISTLVFSFITKITEINNYYQKFNQKKEMHRDNFTMHLGCVVI